MQLDWRLTDQQLATWRQIAHRDPSATIRVRELDRDDVIVLADMSRTGSTLAILDDGTTVRDQS